MEQAKMPTAKGEAENFFFVKAGLAMEWLKATCDAYTKEHPNVTFELDGDADMTVKNRHPVGSRC